VIDTNKNRVTEGLKYRLSSWSGLLIVLVGIVVFIGLGTWLAFALIHRMPQRNVVMTIYPEGSVNAELAARYREVLARKGINLKLVPSAGAVESVARLRDPNSAVSVALIPGGVTTEQDSPELVSLGSLFYQPLWVFSRSRLHLKSDKPLHALRISIGPDGSSSHALSLKLLARAGMFDKKSTILLPLSPSESAQKLIHSEIDVAIFLDAWESPVVQHILETKAVNLVSVQRADAFVALYPYLNKLILPAGVVDMSKPWPPRDVTLIASKSNLVVRRDLHPAIQYTLLEAADEIHSMPGMFHAADQFPAPESIDLRLSPYAREFYKTGTPFLLRHLPFWLAVLLAQPLLLLIPLLVILFPLLRLAPTIYDWVEKKRVYGLYSELKELEDEMFYAAPSTNRPDLIERLDQLENRASHLSVPTPFKPLLYGLRMHIQMVRHAAQKAVSP
jgi:TRAP-type uncharacterized transport system substrate-binding protein